jgi:hypothetical protein
VSAAANAVPYLPGVDELEAGAIDPSRFDHAAHVHVAWCYLRRYRLAEAVARFTAALHALTVRLGATAKYHETVSWFFLVVVAERIAEGGAHDWETFRRDNADLFTDARALIARHYSAELLASPAARSRFVLPDRVPAAEPKGPRTTLRSAPGR